MSLLAAVLLGLVQGMTEFLPVSSSGHLVLFQALLGVQQHDLAFDISAHLGTLLSIFTVFHRVILQTLRDLWAGLQERKINSGVRLVLYVVIGSLPTAVIGLGFKESFERLFDSTQAVGFFLLVTGLLLFLTRKKKSQDKALGEELSRAEDLQGLSWRKSLVIGVAQGLAIAPGISRSGATIATGLFLNVSRKSAAMFSFMLSIPAILGASLLELKDVDWQSQDLSYLWVGGLSSYIFGLLGLWLVLKLTTQGRLEIFSYYLWVVGVVVLVLPLAR